MGKMGNMRKSVDWTVYPCKPDAPDVTIQSDARIAQIDLATGKALLSKACPNGAYFVDLNPIRGATVVDVPADLLDAVKKIVQGSNPDGTVDIGVGIAE
jgi:hypothetical protein